MGEGRAQHATHLTPADLLFLGQMGACDWLAVEWLGADSAASRRSDLFRSHLLGEMMRPTDLAAQTHALSPVHVPAALGGVGEAQPSFGVTWVVSSASQALWGRASFGLLLIHFR